MHVGRGDDPVTALAIALTVLVLLDNPVLTAEPSPPGQPIEGPGGSAYAYETMTIERVGELPSGAWVFLPGGVADRDLSGMPVILFLHGFGATDPQTYRAWITHLARRGNIVVYPDYQPAGFLVPDQSGFVANLLAGVRRGLATAGVAPEAVHVVGHSLGGVLGTAYLAAGPAAGLPPAASLTVIAPGGCGTCGTTEGFGVPLPDNPRAPDGLLVHVVTGSEDTIVGDGDARAIWSRLDAVPEARKRFVEVRSDRHGEPALVADHLFAQSDGFGSEVDALDWYGAWRPLDSLIACAEEGALCDVALGANAAAFGMGAWSDGTPVTLPVVVDGGRAAQDRSV